MSEAGSTLLAASIAWLKAERAIDSAVLFGSAATLRAHDSRADGWSDVDVHVITKSPTAFCEYDWVRAFRTQRFCLRSWQPATGGTIKATIVFSAGHIDVVFVSRLQMRLARWSLRFGLHRREGFIREALNEMATSMQTGYRFLKGAGEWADIYERVVTQMPGVRLTDASVRELAAAFLVNLLLALERLERGELVAVQYLLHRYLVETNLRFSRELRMRLGFPLPSFGLGRRAEILLSPFELSLVQVSATLTRDDLLKALKFVFGNMKVLTNRLLPGWDVPSGFNVIIAACTPDFAQLDLPSRLGTE